MDSIKIMVLRAKAKIIAIEKDYFEE